MSAPLAIDLFCGLGGWTDGLIAEGWGAIGFDIERHLYGDMRYPAQLVIQDVLTLDGAQFKSADLIVASPPCQEYSYMAMPWSRAKQIEAEYKSGVRNTADLNALFDACFRIQREACEAAGRHIPMVVENVRGAQKWVGRSRFNYGSFHLWGDVPALMPMTAARKMAGYNYQKDSGKKWGPNNISPSSDRFTDLAGQKVPGFRFDGSGKSFQSASVEHTGVKAPDMNWSDQTKRGQDFTRIAGDHAIGGVKVGDPESLRRHGSKSPARKMASAMIAKIPMPLSRHIAKAFKP